MSEFPNAKQKKVMEHRGKPLIVIAGPGTGKTTTLVQRIIQVLTNEATAPVALITFTRLSRRKSNEEIKKSVAEASEEIPGTEIPRVATVHTFAKGLVHMFPREVGLQADFHVLIDGLGEVDLLLGEALEDIGVSVDLSALKEMLWTQRDSRELKPIPSLGAAKSLAVIQAFEKLCRFYNAIDINSLVILAALLLEKKPEVLTPLWLHVDEYQDLNVADQRMIGALVKDARRQTVAVGDDAQSIYGFRHAAHTGIGQVFQDNAWEPVQFDESIRMSSSIKLASQALLATSPVHYLGAMPPEPAANVANKVPLVRFTTIEVEHRAIVARISHLKAHGTNRKGAALEWRDFMILCPATTGVEGYVKALEEAGTPVRTKQRTKPTEADCRLLLALRLASRDDSLALRQCLERAALPKADINSWRHKAIAQLRSLFEQLRSEETQATRVIEAIDQVRSHVEDPAQFLDALVAIPGLETTAQELAERGLTAEALGPARVRPARLSKQLYERLGVLDPDTDIPDEDKVLVTTIYSSKGLEAEAVFLVQMNADLMPMPKRDPEEQRRLLYVAMTRPKRELVISFLDRRIQVGQRWKLIGMGAASPFLREIVTSLAPQRVGVKDVQEWASRPQV